jgi:hypothetical protein
MIRFVAFTVAVAVAMTMIAVLRARSRSRRSLRYSYLITKPDELEQYVQDRLRGVKGPDTAEWGDAARADRGADHVPELPLTRREIRRQQRAAAKDLQNLLRELDD